MSETELNYSSSEWIDIKNWIAEASNCYLFSTYYNEEECKILLSQMEGDLICGIDKNIVYKKYYKMYYDYLISKNLVGIYIFISKNRGYYSIGDCFDICESFQLIYPYIKKDSIKFEKILIFFKNCVDKKLVVEFS